MGHYGEGCGKYMVVDQEEVVTQMVGRKFTGGYRGWGVGRGCVFKGL